MNRIVAIVSVGAFVVIGHSLPAAVPGDYDGNDVRDVGDLDLLTDSIVNGKLESEFDLNDDGDVNYRDRDYWIERLSNTWYGDSNLDGEFNTSDFITVFIANKYETGERAGWAEGDWNGDQLFNSNEFNFFFLEQQLSGFEKGPRPGGFQPVPEPHSWQSILCFSLLLVNRKSH